MAKRKVVILGAGFAGLQLARRIKNSDYEITIIDQYNFHQFQPLFYQVATARLEPSSISLPRTSISLGMPAGTLPVTPAAHIRFLVVMVSPL